MAEYIITDQGSIQASLERDFASHLRSPHILVGMLHFFPGWAASVNLVGMLHLQCNYCGYIAERGQRIHCTYSGSPTKSTAQGTSADTRKANHQETNTVSETNIAATSSMSTTDNGSTRNWADPSYDKTIHTLAATLEINYPHSTLGSGSIRIHSSDKTSSVITVDPQQNETLDKGTYAYTTSTMDPHSFFHSQQETSAFITTDVAGGVLHYGFL